MEIFDRLWAGQKSFDYEGKNYKLKAPFSQPLMAKTPSLTAVVIVTTE